MTGTAPFLHSLPYMTKTILIIAAVIYWACFVGRVYLWDRELTSVETKLAYLEKAALLVFTAGLVFYIGRLQIIDGHVHSENYDRPVSFLLFAWALSAANLVTEIFYANRATAVYANFWCGLTLSVSASTAAGFRLIFTDDLDWLSFHRLCFLLGYAFCVLAGPLALRYFWYRFRARGLKGEAKAHSMRARSFFDRMTYRMVLWALPLLTAGIITEALVLLEKNRLPSPAMIWNDKTETLLALAAWFLCGLFLHTRLFFGWRNFKSATLYVVGMAALLGAHIVQGLHRLG
ncbi:MAG: hypothetical protein EOP11_11270 [Proteobacteria bacterium]|nr:MAG: hypothetical protein EOP11_11270 [Pseudomonadota bacterium]